MSRRTARVAEQLRAEIARMLCQEVADPRIRLVTLTRVDVAPDLSQARVFWSAMDSEGDPPLERVAAGLESAAPFLRRRLAQVLPLKRTPALSFRHDPSLALGSETSSLLHSLSDGEKA